MKTIQPQTLNVSDYIQSLVFLLTMRKSIIFTVLSALSFSTMVTPMPLQERVVVYQGTVCWPADSSLWPNTEN